MKSNDSEKTNNEGNTQPERVVIKTGKSTYAYTKSWVENDALKDILVGLVAEDFKQ